MLHGGLGHTHKNYEDAARQPPTLECTVSRESCPRQSARKENSGKSGNPHSSNSPTSGLFFHRATAMVIPSYLTPTRTLTRREWMELVKVTCKRWGRGKEFVRAHRAILPEPVVMPSDMITPTTPAYYGTIPIPPTSRTCRFILTPKILPVAFDMLRPNLSISPVFESVTTRPSALDSVM